MPEEEPFKSGANMYYGRYTYKINYPYLTQNIDIIYNSFDSSTSFVKLLIHGYMSNQKPTAKFNFEMIV